MPSSQATLKVVILLEVLYMKSPPAAMSDRRGTWIVYAWIVYVVMFAFLCYTDIVDSLRTDFKPGGNK